MSTLQQWQVRQRQALPLEIKIRLSKVRIRQWYEYHQGQVYIAFSGGKDSTVLVHLVRSLYPQVLAVFCDTGLEFPELKQFVQQTPNTTTIRPKMAYPAVLERYGYPVVSKEQSHYIYQIRHTHSDKLRALRLNGSEQGMFKLAKKWRYLLEAPFEISDFCCEVMKKRPVTVFERLTGMHQYVGLMASDSRQRLRSYRAHSCNAFDLNHSVSRPMMFWLEQDVWNYLRLYNVPYCNIYDKGYDRTGCIFCLFGMHMEGEPNRFERLKGTHPKLYKYCMDNLGIKEVLEWYPKGLHSQAQ